MAASPKALVAVNYSYCASCHRSFPFAGAWYRPRTPPGMAPPRRCHRQTALSTRLICGHRGMEILDPGSAAATAQVPTVATGRGVANAATKFSAAHGIQAGHRLSTVRLWLRESKPAGSLCVQRRERSPASPNWIAVIGMARLLSAPGAGAIDEVSRNAPAEPDRLYGLFELGAGQGAVVEQLDFPGGRIRALGAGGSHQLGQA
jgi:hypothetical protein